MSLDPVPGSTPPRRFTAAEYRTALGSLALLWGLVIVLPTAIGIFTPTMFWIFTLLYAAAVAAFTQRRVRQLRRYREERGD